MKRGGRERERASSFLSPQQEERAHNTTMKSELNMLEGVLEKSGDQTKEELRTLKQMFEQSEQSRNTCELVLFTVHNPFRRCV